MEIRSQILFVCFFIVLSISYSQERGNMAETNKKAMDYYKRAETMLETGKYRAADSLYLLAQEEFQEINEGKFLISCLIQRTSIKYRSGSVNEAIRLLEKTETAFDIYQISHKDSLYSNYLNGKGYCFILNGELKLAEKVYLEAVEIRLQHPDGTTDSFIATHTLNNNQIKWFKAGSALNLIRQENQ